MVRQRFRPLELTAVLLGSLFLAGCATSPQAAAPIVVGTTAETAQLDPAAWSDSGSQLVQSQIFGSLLRSTAGGEGVAPELAERAVLSNPTTYTVTLRPNLTFSNGHRLTSSDVVFSFTRLRKIASPGAAELLASLAGVTAKNDRTVVFSLHRSDPSFQRMLASSVASIVDEEVFSSTPTSNQTIVAGHAYDGQYAIDSYHPDRLITFTRNSHYAGSLGVARTAEIDLKYYSNTTDLRLDVEDGTVDVATQGVLPTDVTLYSKQSALKVLRAPGRETRYLVFDLATMPFANDPSAALKTRQAIADLVDRSSLSALVDENVYVPLYSFVPQGVVGADPVLETAFGDGNGGPSVAKAAALMKDLALPVELDIEYSPGRFGASSTAEFSELSSQLQNGGLFHVVLTKKSSAVYDSERRSGAYKEYQFASHLGVPDAARSLQETFGAGGVSIELAGSSAITDALGALASEPNVEKRAGQLASIQTQLGVSLPILPLLQSEQTVVVRDGITGVRLDPFMPIRFGDLVEG